MRTYGVSVGKKRRTAGAILIVLGGAMLIGSAVAKFAPVPKLVDELGGMGFDGNKLIFIATLEILSALLFLIPATRSVGLLMISTYLGGAVATHVGHDQPAIQSAIVLAILWLGTWLRHPQMLWSLSQSAPATNQPPQ